MKAPDLVVIALTEYLCTLNAAVVLLGFGDLLVCRRKVKILPFLGVEVVGDILCNIFDKRPLISDIAVYILPASEIITIFRLYIGKNLQYILTVINALRYLSELLPYPVKVPGKFDKIEDSSVLLLFGHLRKCHGVKLQGSEKLFEKILGGGNFTSALLYRLVISLFGTLFAVDVKPCIGLDDDLALTLALVDYVVALASVCEGIADRINYRGLSRAVGACYLNRSAVKLGLAYSKKVLYLYFCCFHFHILRIELLMIEFAEETASSELAIVFLILSGKSD